MGEETRFARATPCDECPWRRDVATGRFPPERYENMQSTIGTEDGIRPIFACHKSPEGLEYACAGYLLVEGLSNIAVRIASCQRRMDVRALHSPHPLYSRYEEMARANGFPMKDLDREVRGMPQMERPEEILHFLDFPRPQLFHTDERLKNEELHAVLYLQHWQGHEITNTEWAFLMRRDGLTPHQLAWRASLAELEADAGFSFSEMGSTMKALTVAAARRGIGEYRARPLEEKQAAERLHLDDQMKDDAKQAEAQRMCAKFLRRRFPQLAPQALPDTWGEKNNHTL